CLVVKVDSVFQTRCRRFTRVFGHAFGGPGRSSRLRDQPPARCPALKPLLESDNSVDEVAQPDSESARMIELESVCGASRLLLDALQSQSNTHRNQWPLLLREGFA